VEVVLAADPPLDEWDRLLLGHDGELPPADAWSPDGFTPLHLAAFGRNADAARRLLHAGADPDVVARAPYARVTPLGTAAFAGAVEVARVLLEHGVDTELTADGGGTPLHSAAANGNRELVELLVAHGADRAAATDDGRTPADVAADSEIAALVRA
jgi:ankyrin repeat protein